MTAIFRGRDDVIANLAPGGDHRLAHLSDEELLANTRRLVGKSNQLLATLLAHLAEVEARGVHRTRRCASLYTYCIYELRFSEDAAARRSAAARLVKQFPPLFDAIANGELHLTGLLMIGPHLTPENHVAVLGRAKFRTKKELGKLVRDLSPLPQLPDRIEPLGPEPMRAPRNPTWEQYVTSLAPPVRELPPGERPCDWVKEVEVANEVEGDVVAGAGVLGAGVRGVEGAAGVWGLEGAADAADVRGVAGAASGEWVAMGGEDHAGTRGPLPVGPVPRDLPPVTGPQHYQMQFSTVEEHARLVERARALLARTRPRISLGELHLEAMRLFVASLEKRKFAVSARIGRVSAKPSLEGDVPGGDNEPTTLRRRGRDNELTTPRRRGRDNGSHTTSGKSHDRKHGQELNTSAMLRRRGVDDGSESDTTASKSDDGKHGHDQNATTMPRWRGGDNGSGSGSGSDSDTTASKSDDAKHGHDRNATAMPRRRGGDNGSDSDATASKGDDGKHEHDQNATTMPRWRGGDNGSDSNTTASKNDDGKHEHERNATAMPRQRGDDNGSDTTPRRRGDHDDHETDATYGKNHGGKRGHGRNATATPRQRGDLRDTVSRSRDSGGDTTPREGDERDAVRRTRHVPAAERREVYRRDDGQCTYVDPRGERCCETRYLELHHLQPFAKNGANAAANLTLRCSAHNALAAEEDFGSLLVAERRNSMRHEALARQQLVADYC